LLSAAGHGFSERLILSGMIERRKNIHQQLKENEQRLNDLKKQLHVTQKLALIGTTACLAAHEFNNLLLSIINYSELALKQQDDVDLVRKALEKTITNGNRAAVIIQSMLGAATCHRQEHQMVPLAGQVEECFHCMGRDLGKDNINVKVDIPDDLTVFGDPGQLQQVLLNLIINARQAMLACGGTLTIEAHKLNDSTVQIKVSDTGCGIEPDIVGKIFEPFFSTKTDAKRPDQRGSGLGLSICQDIINSHNGSISASGRPGQGATFTIVLPVSDTTPATSDK
jgi:signal transduction histidine kinase